MTVTNSAHAEQELDMAAAQIAMLDTFAPDYHPHNQTVTAAREAHWDARTPWG